MTYDTLTMTAVAEELQEQAVGARVQRVIQPSREEIVLLLYCAGQEFGLLLSTHPRHARIHLTRRRYRLPEKPPPFCMLLRGSKGTFFLLPFLCLGRQGKQGDVLFASIFMP